MLLTFHHFNSDDIIQIAISAAYCIIFIRSINLNSSIYGSWQVIQPIQHQKGFDDSVFKSTNIGIINNIPTLANRNLNDLNTAQLCYISIQTCTNTPSGFTGVMVLFVFKLPTDVIQFCIGNNSHFLAHRSYDKNSSTWHDWYRVALTAIN